MKPTAPELTAAARAIVQLAADGRSVGNWQQAIDVLVAEYNVSTARASDAVAKAARRLRNARLAEEGPFEYTLRIRLTDAQRRRAQMLADRETGGNLSALFRQRTLG
jgi:hypothetical protein